MGNSPGRYRKEGSEAFHDGFAIADCPYANHMWSNYSDWVEGWNDASKSEAKLLTEEYLTPEESAIIDLKNNINQLRADESLKEILIRIVEMGKD